MVLRFLRMMFADVSVPDSGSSEHASAWEARSLVWSVRRALFTFVAAWQAVMIFATFSTLSIEGWVLVVAQVCLAAVALFAITHPVPDPVIPLGMAAIGLWSYLASGNLDSTLVFAACWLINFSSLAAGLLVLRSYAAPLIVAVASVIAGTVMWQLPEWGLQFPISVIITQLSIAVAVKWGMARLMGVASDADRAAAEVAEAHRRTRVSRHVSMQMAEESRVLHDTAINTLGAIANGGVGTADTQKVREQCARDVALLEGMRTQPSYLMPVGLGEVFFQPGLPVRRRGINDDAIARLDRLLPLSSKTAIVGCVREAVRNATKHSGAEYVEVEVLESDTVLTVQVRDRGVGFSGEVSPDGLGIGGSIIGRAQDNGFQAEVVGEPGTGTAVTLTVPLNNRLDEEQSDVHVGGARATEALHRHAGQLWGIGVTAVSIILTLAGGANYAFALYPMIGVMILAWLLYRFVTFDRARTFEAVLLIVCTCTVFFLSAAATAFGTLDVIHWQALAPTGPFVLLLSLADSRKVRAAGAVSWVAVNLMTASLTFPSSTTAAQIVVVAGCVGLAFSGCWAAFQTVLQRLGEQAARSMQQTLDANLRTELEIATQNSYRRWIRAGLDSAVSLLRDIAQGRREPNSVSTRSACGEEERYLRQLVQISPELVNVGHELTSTLRRAREKRISYFLRLGGTDTPDREVAQRIASYVNDVLSSLSPGGMLRASLFPVKEGIQLTLIGAGISPPESFHGYTRHERLGTFDVVEITYPGAVSGADAP